MYQKLKRPPLCSSMRLLSALLAACLSIDLASANGYPCLPAEFIHGYRDFLKHHLASDTPSGLDHAAWEAYLKKTTECSRSLISFLYPTDRNKVEDICTPAAGKQQSGNYCISKNKFTFISVDNEFGTCIVRNVSMVTQHIIVACDMVDDMCRPTHLEENRNGLVPRQQDPPCSFPEAATDSGFVLRAAAQICLLLTLLPLALCYYLG